MMDIHVYFDDSGTNKESPYAIAACYAATKEQWKEFVRNWDDARREEGFDFFHMTDFAARKKKPYCDWSASKRQRVYTRLAHLITIRIRHGFGLAISKEAFEKYPPQHFKENWGKNHYTAAVGWTMGLIRNWRTRYGITEPMQFIFDRGSKGKGEIMTFFEKSDQHADIREHYGLRSDGYAFEDKAVFKPLQAADILAWQLNNHYQNVVIKGLDEQKFAHKNFKMLRYWSAPGSDDVHRVPMELGYITDAQTKAVFEKGEAYLQEKGEYMWK